MNHSKAFAAQTTEQMFLTAHFFNNVTNEGFWGMYIANRGYCGSSGNMV